MNREPGPCPPDDALCQSFLLRLWREGPGGERRALLQDVLSGERRHFPNLAGLFAFLDAPEGQENISGEP